MLYRIVVYRDRAGEYRWRVVAGNGRVVADSAEAYASKSNAVKAATRLAWAELSVEVE